MRQCASAMQDCALNDMLLLLTHTYTHTHARPSSLSAWILTFVTACLICTIVSCPAASKQPLHPVQTHAGPPPTPPQIRVLTLMAPQPSMGAAAATKRCPAAARTTGQTLRAPPHTLPTAGAKTAEAGARRTLLRPVRQGQWMGQAKGRPAVATGARAWAPHHPWA